METRRFSSAAQDCAHPFIHEVKLSAAQRIKVTPASSRIGLLLSVSVWGSLHPFILPARDAQILPETATFSPEPSRAQERGVPEVYAQAQSCL